MSYSLGFLVPGWLRRRTWLVGVLAILAALAGAMSAGAQGSPFSVADFDQNGLQAVVLASFDAGGPTTLYSASDSRWGASGTLVEGDVGIDDETSIVRVMLPNSDGSLLRLNDGGGLTLRDFFGQTGTGADLTVWVQTSAGTASFAASDVGSAGGNYVNFNVPASERAVVSGIAAGDRFLLALTRPATNTPATGDPTITGTVQVGETLTAATSGIADAQGLTNVAYIYQWLADDTEITGATASTYTLTADEEGKAIKVKVSFNDDEGNDEERISAATVAVAAAPATNTAATGDPTITGTAQVGETLTAGTSGIADAEGLDNVAYTYQWLADDTGITGATASSYTLTEAEEGKAIKVKVSFNDDDGNDEERTSAATVAVAAAPATNTAATGAPTITGTAQVGETLTAGTSAIADAEGLTNVAYTYQWLADDTGITGATASSYTLTEAEEGKAIKVKVSFNDDDGNDEERTSAATVAVAAAPATNTVATGDPAITGTAQVGQTLTAGTSGIADAEGLTNVAYTYQWLADDTGITGATASTYALTTAEEGKAIKVKVSFSDDEGNGEERTSAATVAVTAAVAEAATAASVSVSEPPTGDLVAGTSTTGVVAPDAAARGVIREVAGWSDSDWFAAEFTASTSYVIEILSASTGGCTLRAPVLEGVYDSSGTLIAGTEWSNANRGSIYTELTFTPDTSGTHYIAVTSEANLLGTYVVALTAGADGSAERITAIGEQGCFPAAPSGLGTSGIAHNSVTLSWTAPDAPGITGYQVLRGTSAASLSAIEADTGGTATTYTDSSAAASTTYHYAVAAITAVGPGPPVHHRHDDHARQATQEPQHAQGQHGAGRHGPDAVPVV